MTNKLAILGASGHGKVIAEIGELLGYTIIFFDDAYPHKNHIEHWPIAGDSKDMILLSSRMSGIVAIGDNQIRAEKTRWLLENGINIISLAHPHSFVSKYSHIGVGTVILASASINAFANIGLGCIINTGAIVEHDCSLSDFVHLCPNVALAGGVSVGENTLIGLGTNVKQLINIGGNAIIGAGSTVVKNIPDNVTAFGVAATVK